MENDAGIIILQEKSKTSIECTILILAEELAQFDQIRGAGQAGRAVPHCEAPAFAAFSASHHQICGKPMAYSGSGSG